MFVPNVKILLGEWECAAVNEVVIESDINTLTDTCTIILPKKIQWEGFNGAQSPIRRGDKVRVSFGYDQNYINEFKGYIKSVGNGTPIKIICEDQMWGLKQSAIKKEVFRQIKLKALVETLIQQSNIIEYQSIQVQCPIDIEIGNYRITRNTIAEELEDLKKVYGFYAYFRRINNEDILYVGWGYPTDQRATHRFQFSKNIIDENSLEFVEEKDVKLKVKATSILKTNKRIEVETGDNDGELRTINVYNMKEDDLQKYAVSEMNRFKYTGFRGSFTTFGHPSVRVTDIVRIQTQNGTTGSYLIHKLSKTYNTSIGIKQKIFLGAKIA